MGCAGQGRRGVVLAPNGVALEAQLIPTMLPKPGLPVLDPKKQTIEVVRGLSKDDFGDAMFDAQGKWTRPVAGTAQR